MKLIKNLFRFYIHSNIHVALAVMSLVAITQYDYQIKNAIALLFSGVATVLAYNFIRIFHQDELKDSIQIWLKKHSLMIKGLMVVCALCLVLMVWHLPSSVYFWLAVSFVATLFYVLPVYKQWKLRNIPGLKLFLISTTWVVVTVVLPLKISHVEIDFTTLLEAAQRFFFIVLITIPFDIRDMDFDQSSLKTLPQVLGLKKVKIIGVVCAVICLILSLIIDIQNSIICVIVLILSVFLLLKSSANQKPYYASFWIEAIPIFWFALVYFFN